MGSRVFKNGFISTEKSMLNIEKLGDARILKLYFCKSRLILQHSNCKYEAKSSDRSSDIVSWIYFKVLRVEKGVDWKQKARELEQNLPEKWTAGYTLQRPFSRLFFGKVHPSWNRVMMGGGNWNFLKTKDDTFFEILIKYNL